MEEEIHKNTYGSSLCCNDSKNARNDNRKNEKERGKEYEDVWCDNNICHSEPKEVQVKNPVGKGSMS